MFLIYFNVHRAFDRGGVLREDLREAPRHSFWDQRSVGCRQRGAAHLLHLRRCLHILLFSTRLSFADLCWGAPAHSLPAHCLRSDTQSPVRYVSMMAINIYVTYLSILVNYTRWLMISVWIDSLVGKLKKVCVAGVQSLVQHSEYEVKEGGFLHNAAIWVKNQLLTVPLDIKR